MKRNPIKQKQGLFPIQTSSLLYGEFWLPLKEEGGRWRFPIDIEDISQRFKLKLPSMCRWSQIIGECQTLVGTSKVRVYSVVPAFLVFISGSYNA